MGKNMKNIEALDRIAFEVAWEKAYRNLEERIEKIPKSIREQIQIDEIVEKYKKNFRFDNDLKSSIEKSFLFIYNEISNEERRISNERRLIEEAKEKAAEKRRKEIQKERAKIAEEERKKAEKLSQKYDTPQKVKKYYKQKYNNLEKRKVKTKEQLKKGEMYGVPVSLLTEDAKGNKTHQYVFRGPHAKEYEREYGTDFSTATEISEYLLGDDFGDIDKELQQLEKKLQQQGKLSAADKKRKSDLERYKEIAKKGTVFHAAAEELAKNAANWDKLSEKERKQFLRRCDAKEEWLDDLIEQIESYNKYLKAHKFTFASASEQAFGAVMKDKSGKTRLVAGTLDQVFFGINNKGLYLDSIEDFKTSKGIKGQYPLQLNILKELAKASGFDVDSTSLGLINSPRVDTKKGQKGSTTYYNVDSLGSEKIYKVLLKFFELKYKIDIETQTEVEKIEKEYDQKINRAVSSVEKQGLKEQKKAKIEAVKAKKEQELDAVRQMLGGVGLHGQVFTKNNKQGFSVNYYNSSPELGDSAQTMQSLLRGKNSLKNLQQIYGSLDENAAGKETFLQDLFKINPKTYQFWYTGKNAEAAREYFSSDYNSIFNNPNVNPKNEKFFHNVDKDLVTYDTLMVGGQDLSVNQILKLMATLSGKDLKIFSDALIAALTNARNHMGEGPFRKFFEKFLVNEEQKTSELMGYGKTKEESTEEAIKLARGAEVLFKDVLQESAPMLFEVLQDVSNQDYGYGDLQAYGSEKKNVYEPDTSEKEQRIRFGNDEVEANLIHKAATEPNMSPEQVGARLLRLVDLPRRIKIAVQAVRKKMEEQGMPFDMTDDEFIEKFLKSQNPALYEQLQASEKINELMAKEEKRQGLVSMAYKMFGDITPEQMKRLSALHIEGDIEDIISKEIFSSIFGGQGDYENFIKGAASYNYDSKSYVVALLNMLSGSFSNLPVEFQEVAKRYAELPDSLRPGGEFGKELFKWFNLDKLTQEEMSEEMLSDMLNRFINYTGVGVVGKQDSGAWQQQYGELLDSFSTGYSGTARKFLSKFGNLSPEEGLAFINNYAKYEDLWNNSDGDPEELTKIYEWYNNNSLAQGLYELSESQQNKGSYNQIMKFLGFYSEKLKEVEAEKERLAQLFQPFIAMAQELKAKLAENKKAYIDTGDKEQEMAKKTDAQSKEANAISNFSLDTDPSISSLPEKVDQTIQDAEETQQIISDATETVVQETENVAEVAEEAKKVAETADEAVKKVKAKAKRKTSKKRKGPQKTVGTPDVHLSSGTSLDTTGYTETGVFVNDVGEVVARQMVKEVEKTNWGKILADAKEQGLSKEDLIAKLEEELLKKSFYRTKAGDLNSAGNKKLNDLLYRAGYTDVGTGSSHIANIDANVEWIKTNLNILGITKQQKYTKTLPGNPNNPGGPNNPITPKEEAANKREYLSLLREELTLEKKLEDLKRRSNLTGNKSWLGALGGSISTTEQLLANARSKRQALEGSLPQEFINQALGDYSLKLGSAVSDVDVKYRGARNIWDALAQDIGRSFTRMFDFNIAARIMNKFRQSVQKVVNIVKELDKAMTNIKVVTGLSTEETEALIVKYNGLAKQLGVTTTQIAEAANAWLRQGYNVQQTEKLITASMQLSKLGMLDAATATKVLTSAIKGFHMEASQASVVVDKLTKLDMNYAASAGDIGEALSRVAATAQSVNLTMDQTAGILTVIMDVTQAGAERAGTALQSMLSRFGNVKAGAFTEIAEDADDTATAINDIDRVLNVVGITVRTQGGNIRSWMDVLDELNDKWATLDDVSRNAIATAVAGTRNRNFFNTIMNNWNEIKEAVDISANSVGTAAEKYEDAYANSIEATVNRLTAAWEGFSKKVLNSEVVKGFLKLSSRIVENFDLILSHLTSFLTVFSAYKIPSWLGQLRSSLSISGSSTLTAAGIHGPINPYASGQGGMKSIVQSGFNRVSSLLQNQTAIMQTQTVGTGEMAGAWANRRGKLNPVAQDIYDKNKQLLNGRRYSWNNKTIQRLQARAAAGDQAAINKLARYNSLQNAQFQNDFMDSPAFRKNKFIFGADGQRYYYEGSGANRVWKDASGKIITDPAQKQALQEAKSMGAKARFSQAAMTGIVSGVASGMMGPGSGVGSKIAIASGGFKVGNTSINDVENSWQDNLITGVATGAATGLLSAIPGIGPILGPTLGPILGDLTGSIFKFFGHQAEMERKERAETAKKELEALAKYSDTINNAVTQIGKAVSSYSSSDWQTFYKAMDTYTEALKDENIGGKLTAAMRQALADQGIDENTIDAIMDNIANGNYTALAGSNMAAVTQAAASAVTKLQGEATYASQTEEIYKLQVKQRELSAMLDSGDYGKYKTRSKVMEELSSVGAQLGTYENDLLYSVIKSYAENHGISNIPEYEKRSRSIEGLTYEIAKGLGEGVGYNAETGIFSNVQQLIEKYLRTELDFGTTTSKSKSLSAFVRDTKFIGKTIEDVTQYKNIVFSTAERDVKTIQTLAETLGMSETQLREFLIGYNTTQVQTMANSLGLTVDQLTELEDKFGWLTSSDVAEGVKSLVSLFEDWNSILGDIADNGTLTIETIDKIAEKHPELFVDTESGTFSTDNVLSNIAKALAEGGNSEWIETIGRTRATEIQTSSVYWSQFINQYMKEQGLLDTFGAENANILKQAENYEAALHAITTDSQKDLSEQYEAFSKAVAGSADEITKVADILIERQQHLWDIEINNLKSIKDSLDDINKQREKELKLIEAKQKLENAEKEMVRRYRSGLGFIYEADQEAIKKAQEELETAQNDVTKEDLQYQIDVLEQQKSILSDIKENQKWEAVEGIWKEFKDHSLGNYTPTKFAETFGSSETFAEGIKTAIGQVYANQENTNKKNAQNDVEHIEELQNKLKTLMEHPPKETASYTDKNNWVKDVSDAQSELTNARANFENQWRWADGTSKFSEAKGAVEKYNSLGKDDKLMEGFELTTSDVEPGSYLPFYYALKGISIGIKDEDAPWWQAPGNRYKSINDFYNDSARWGNIGGNYYVAFDKNGKMLNTSEPGWVDYILSEHPQYYSVSPGEWKQIPDDTYVFGNKWLHFYGGKWYDVGGDHDYNYNPWEEPKRTNAMQNYAKVVSKNASGTYSFGGGSTLLNELGTEAIITPYGTLTSLPSKSGIVPADLTRNLYALGEVAPQLIKRFYDNTNYLKNDNRSVDESTNINTLNATFNVDGEFNPKEFMVKIKQAAALTKRNPV